MQTENWKKRSTKMIKPSKLSENETVVEGYFTGTRNREIVDRQTGELKTITDLLFKNEAGEVMAVPQDSGLRVAFSDARVAEKELVKIVKLAQIKNSVGQPLNQYDIFVQ